MKVHRQLLRLVREVVQAGCEGGQRPQIEALAWPEPFRAPQASFVTLSTLDGQLRGCCGDLYPTRSMVEELAENAWRTAFGDPRFKPIEHHELPNLHIDVSLLSPLQQITCASPAELMAAIEPGVHGLLIACGRRRATFLPKVWEQLPEPTHFLRRLRHKAGLPDGEWHPATQAWSYTAECFGEPFVADCAPRSIG